MEKTMKKAQTQRLEALAPTKGADEKTYWKRVGVAFPLKNREGFSLKLEFLPVPSDGAYEFILVAPSPRKTAQA